MADLPVSVKAHCNKGWLLRLPLAGNLLANGIEPPELAGGVFSPPCRASLWSDRGKLNECPG
jgi:hypothetical protein